MRADTKGGFLSLAAFALLLVFLVAAAGAQSERDYFKGKTITVIAGSSPGGGTDSLARLLAAHFGKHVPGNPKVVVTNMAGAAGLIAANHLYNRSPKDGTEMGTMATGLTFRTALRDEKIKFQLDKFTYLGQIASEGNFVYFRSDTPYASFEAIRKANREGKKPKMGAQAKEHNSNVVPKAIGAILGVEFDVVYGYPGTAEILLDIERGALDGRAHARGSLFATRKHWLDQNFIKVLVVTSPERDKRLPNVPTLEEIAPPDKKPLLEAMYSVQGRTFAMPPGVPPERAKVLRDAFAAMFKDPEFQKDVDKLGWNDELIRGEDLQKKVHDLVNNDLAMGFFRELLK
ncbi:MAG TPA: tripartite tricarboxylate transporter substrate-binding protein [Candidatus Acidoferrales bacterium]|nr:tripartite tricarboxylate transporter substrate-binding protein [Candidatus Acidoferrales bacterium]